MFDKKTTINNTTKINPTQYDVKTGYVIRHCPRCEGGGSSSDGYGYKIRCHICDGVGMVKIKPTLIKQLKDLDY